MKKMKNWISNKCQDLVDDWNHWWWENGDDMLFLAVFIVIITIIANV